MLDKSRKKQFGFWSHLDSMFYANICQHVLIMRVLIKCCTENTSPSQAPALAEVHHMQVKAVKYLKNTQSGRICVGSTILVTYICKAFRINNVFN